METVACVDKPQIHDLKESSTVYGKDHVLERSRTIFIARSNW